MRIFINPGHADGGKPDPGAVNPNFHGYRLCEYSLARRIGDEVAGYLRAIGEEVRVLQSHNLLGECPAYPCVVDVANTWGADLFLSIHINAGGGRGCETFCYRANSSGMEFARAIQNELHRTLYTLDKGFHYRGVFTRPTLAVLKQQPIGRHPKTLGDLLECLRTGLGGIGLIALDLLHMDAGGIGKALLRQTAFAAQGNHALGEAHGVQVQG